MKPITDIEQRVLTVLMTSGHIVNSVYDITEDTLSAYMNAYVITASKGEHKLNSSNHRFARKLAGLTLMKHNISLGANVSQIKAGMVYLLENPAFQDHFKIGMTVDIDARLQTYQTSDPFRSFKFKHYEFVLDRKYTEKRILKNFKLSVEKGEWVKKENAIPVFNEATRYR